MTEVSLDLWTIYDHPKDHPGGFIARRFEVGIFGHRPTRDTIHSSDLEELRTAMQERGLYCIPRSEGDDPVIIETWV